MNAPAFNCQVAPRATEIMTESLQDLTVPYSAGSSHAAMISIFRKLPDRFQRSADWDCYRKLGTLRPVLGRSMPNARMCILGRDPGHDEVQAGVPFVGASGVELRKSLTQFVDPEVDVYWANTVSFKRIGNKCWPKSVQKEFFLQVFRLLCSDWGGHEVITLGEHAFKWFALGMAPEAEQEWLNKWQKKEERFLPQTSHRVTLKMLGYTKQFVVHPLPHPSPQNGAFRKAFPMLLDDRLTRLLDIAP